MTLPFPPAPKAHPNLKVGSLFAIDGGDGFVYYGQVAPFDVFAFPRFRSHTLDAAGALSAPIMSRFVVQFASVVKAVRGGIWVTLGRQPLWPELNVQPVMAQWPVRTQRLTLWQGSQMIRDAMASDPDVQDVEVLAAYDASAHVPRRLVADFNLDVEAGGSVLGHRLKKER